MSRYPKLSKLIIALHWAAALLVLAGGLVYFERWLADLG
jgi:cytochrome b561